MVGGQSTAAVDRTILAVQYAQNNVDFLSYPFNLLSTVKQQFYGQFF